MSASVGGGNVGVSYGKTKKSTSTATSKTWTTGSLIGSEHGDGEYTLSGDDGFVSRTELAYAIPKINQEIYTAFDFGRVWGPGSEWLLGQSLSGVALGLRGAIKQFSYDVFISRPVNKPDRYPGDRWVGGFSASVQF